MKTIHENTSFKLFKVNFLQTTIISIVVRNLYDRKDKAHLQNIYF